MKLNGGARGAVIRTLTGLMSRRTLRALRFELLRSSARVRRRGERDVVPPHPLLHFGCGPRRVSGWLNVDVAGSEYDVDLAAGRLPWRTGSFDAAVGQHVIPCLELTEELIPLLRELRRVVKAGGELWVSCTDIDKACRSYLEHGMTDLVADRQARIPGYTMEGKPARHFINVLFHYEGLIRNIFDFELLAWTLQEAGFTGIEKVVEADLLRRFPEFPSRDDDLQTLYVRATVPYAAEAL